jgi:tRNA threonylcarbamoyladenosine biosynthesis protein TsaE
MDGELGAGKTTLTRGIAEGIGVRGPVTSPTFVIVREHAARGDTPGLVHVDAYRLGSADEVDDLDLGPAMVSSVTVVEWAGEVAAHLHREPLALILTVIDEDARTVRWRAEGARWAADLSRVAGCAESSSQRSAPDPPA